MSLLEWRGGPRRLLFDAEFGEALSELGWFAYAPTPTPLPADSAAQSGPEGRARTRIVALLSREERLHLRPLRHGGVLRKLWGDRLLGAGRGTRELNDTAELHARGAPVPRPVALCGLRSGLFWRGELVTLHVEDSVNGLAFLRDRPTRERVERASAAAGRAVRLLHDAGARHADLHLANLLLCERCTASEVIVIDFDKARVGAPPPAARRMQEIMRLYRSLRKHGLQERVGPRGYAAFLSAYVARDRELRRALLGQLQREQLRIKLHAWAYRNAGR